MSPANGHAQKAPTRTPAPPPAMLTPQLFRFPQNGSENWWRPWKYRLTHRKSNGG
jgi:hypothetical protein